MSKVKDNSYGLIPFYWEDGTPRYFIGRSVSADGRTGFWKFPKGHKEVGETEIAAGMRETAEEIGVDIEETDVLTAQSFTERYIYTRGAENKRGAGTVEKTNTYWLARVEPSTEVNLNEEFSEYRWVTLDEALDLLPENSRAFLKEAHEFLMKTKMN